MEFSELKNTVKKRLAFIETRLFWEGSISRGNIVKFFNISEPQATNDLVMYHDLAPHNAKYNKSRKCYEKTEDFTPIISKQSSKGYFNRLIFSRRIRNNNDFFCGRIPPHAVVPILNTVTDDKILKKILMAIQNNMAVKIEYQSDTRPKPIWRWITPHSFGYNGFRWHIRALCHKRNEYRDFVLPRIISSRECVEHSFDHGFDYEWHKEIQLIIIANDKLDKGKKNSIELEYGMKDGELTVDIKAAFYYYLEKQYSFKDEENIEKTNKLILLNKKEVEFQVDFLKSMGTEKIKENFTFAY